MSDEETRAGHSRTGSHGSQGALVQQVQRPRGGYRQTPNTIPECLARVQPIRGPPTNCRPIELMANYVPIQPMEEQAVYKYRVDFEPEVESLRLRARLFSSTTKDTFGGRSNYDKMNDLFSSVKIRQNPTVFFTAHPTQPEVQIKIIVKETGVLVWNSFEMLRLYNMHMKEFLEKMGFFKISRTGSFVHPDLRQSIGKNDEIIMIRGFNTSANIFDQGKILMNLEPVHKLMQRRNVLEVMMEIRKRVGDSSYKEAIEAELTGKLIVAHYNRTQIYRIEAFEFDESPKSTFDMRGKEVSFLDYFKQRYEINIRHSNQPLLRVILNNSRASHCDKDGKKVIKMVPELCNIAGLTQTQLSDNRLKNDLIRISQVAPRDRVSHVRIFLSKLHDNPFVKELLSNWGYSYSKEPVKLTGYQLPPEGIGCSRHLSAPPTQWPSVNPSANFEHILKARSGPTIDKGHKFPSLTLLYPQCEQRNQGAIGNKLRQGFEKVGLIPTNVESVSMSGDQSNHYVKHLSSLIKDKVTIAIVVMPKQDKEKYDTIKKLAAVNMGLTTQVVTSRLILDPQKGDSACMKIAIQVAAKIGAEPWRVFIPLRTSMICGYDTHHDTSKRGRSFGAFVASMNEFHTRWFSKTDAHDRLQELSSQMSKNIADSLQRYREINNRYPERVYIYRDGVGEGQLHQVFEVEIKQVKQQIEEIDPNIKLTFLVVNKRIGARFFACHGADFDNPPPGTIVTETVRRQERCDFYLISQSTRNGTVTPTYYNIIHMDDTVISRENIQHLSYKLCLLYYNWAGSVRVPAPCQYAHKLAFFCGEHLHQVPNVNLNDRLHFL